MWYDVREGLKKPSEASPAVGLQRILALKRLESSPVSFLISLLRLTVLHAHRVEELRELSLACGAGARAEGLARDFAALLARHPNARLRTVRWLASAEPFTDPPDCFFEKMHEG